MAQMSAHPTIFVETYRPPRRKQRSGKGARAIRLAPHEIGRDAHFGPGWWMVPAVTLGIAMWVGLFAFIL